MNAFVDRILKSHLSRILDGDRVCIPDDPEELNWRCFFAHSQDMQGFRADIFTGGPNEVVHSRDPLFIGLRDRWGRDSRSLIGDLAQLWRDPDAQRQFKALSDPHRPAEAKRAGVAPAIALLRDSGIEGPRVFAETLDALRGDRIARKSNKMIRAYVQNSAVLWEDYGGSFREYLRNTARHAAFPPNNVSSAEPAWISAIARDFYNVGDTLARYMICDWLLWLWRENRIDWFSMYKADSVHLDAVAKRLLPDAAGSDFVAYCRSIQIPSGFGAASRKPCPPRVLNECIWLELNASSGNQQPA